MFTPAVRPRGEPGGSGDGVDTGTEPHARLARAPPVLGPGGAVPAAAGAPFLPVPLRSPPLRSAPQRRPAPGSAPGPRAREPGRGLLSGRLLLALPLALSPSAPRRISAGQTPTPSHRCSPLHGRVCPAPPGSRRKAQGRIGPRTPGAGSETAGGKGSGLGTPGKGRLCPGS